MSGYRNSSAPKGRRENFQRSETWTWVMSGAASAGEFRSIGKGIVSTYVHVPPLKTVSMDS
jgi:hypothetical protein